MERNKCDLNCDKKGEHGKYHTLNFDQAETMKFRFNFPVQTLCHEHYELQFTLYPHSQTKCSDPCLRHIRPAKVRLVAISLDLAKQVKQFTEHRVIPGKTLCRTCVAHLQEVISSNEDVAEVEVEQYNNGERNKDTVATEELDLPEFDSPEFDSPM